MNVCDAGPTLIQHWIHIWLLKEEDIGGRASNKPGIFQVCSYLMVVVSAQCQSLPPLSLVSPPRASMCVVYGGGVLSLWVLQINRSCQHYYACSKINRLPYICPKLHTPTAKLIGVATTTKIATVEL